MVNNLGATPLLEMNIVAHAALHLLEEEYKVGGSVRQYRFSMIDRYILAVK